MSRCRKGRYRRTPFERLHGKKLTQKFVPFGEKVLARQISREPLNRMSPRYKFGVSLGVRINSAECFVGTAEGVFRAREVRRIEHQDRWDKEAINNVIGVPWRIADRKWIVDRPVTQIDPWPPPPVPHEYRGRITRTDIETFGTIAGCPGCRSDLESEHELTLTPAEPGLRKMSQNNSRMCKASRSKKRGVE